MAYYSSDAIPEWTNSLLVVTLKAGDHFVQQVFQFKLNEDGVSLTTSTPDAPNPRSYFQDDQFFNGRLRDIAVSPDGRRLYLITNNPNSDDPIIVYTLRESTSSVLPEPRRLNLAQNTPNPFRGQTKISATLKSAGNVRIVISDLFGRRITTLADTWATAGEISVTWDGTNASGQQLPNGVYLYTVTFNDTKSTRKMLLAK